MSLEYLRAPTNSPVNPEAPPRQAWARLCVPRPRLRGGYQPLPYAFQFPRACREEGVSSRGGDGR